MRRQVTTVNFAAAALLTFGLSTAVAQAPPGASAGVVHELMRQPLADQPGTDVVVISVDYPPEGSTPPHEHPGYTYAYVLEGSVVSQVNDRKLFRRDRCGRSSPMSIIWCQGTPARPRPQNCWCSLLLRTDES